MNIKRRGFLTAGGSVAAALSLSALANHLDHDVVPRLAIVDSRIPGAGAVIEEHGSLWVDLAALSAFDLMRLGALIPVGVTVSGYTRWSDFMVLRDLLREQRLRLSRRERRHDIGRGQSVFSWYMS